MILVPEAAGHIGTTTPVRTPTGRQGQRRVVAPFAFQSAADFAAAAMIQDNPGTAIQGRFAVLLPARSSAVLVVLLSGDGQLAKSHDDEEQKSFGHHFPINRKNTKAHVNTENRIKKDFYTSRSKMRYQRVMEAWKTSSRRLGGQEKLVSSFYRQLLLSFV